MKKDIAHIGIGDELEVARSLLDMNQREENVFDDRPVFIIEAPRKFPDVIHVPSINRYSKKSNNNRAYVSDEKKRSIRKMQKKSRKQNRKIK